ncbi:TYRO protein tyrosine kinase-binding protein [Syngnathus typhle]
MNKLSFETENSMKDTFCISNSLFGSGGQQECGACYFISMQSVIGMIVSDIVLTIFIAVSVFYLIILHKKRTQENAKTHGQPEPDEITESPYQELHGIQSDVYSELQHFRK